MANGCYPIRVVTTQSRALFLSPEEDLDSGRKTNKIKETHMHKKTLWFKHHIKLNMINHAFIFLRALLSQGLNVYDQYNWSQEYCKDTKAGLQLNGRKKQRGMNRWLFSFIDDMCLFKLECSRKTSEVECALCTHA